MHEKDLVCKKGKEMLVSLQEEKLLLFFRNELKYGEARIIVKDGQPVNIWRTLKNIKLD